MKTEDGDRYSTIRYNIRKHLKISLTEYCYCDIVYHLSASRKSYAQGWATAGNDYYGDLIGMTDRGIRKLKQRMINKGLIEQNEEKDQLLRTTEKWEDAHILGKKEKRNSVPQPELSSGKEELSSGKEELSSGKEELSSANSNNSNPYKENNSNVQDLIFYQQKIKELKIKEDNIISRKLIWENLQPYLKTKDFENNWRFLAGQYFGVVDPEKLIKTWVTQCDNFYQVKTLSIHKIGGWIKNSATKTDKNGSSQPQIITISENVNEF